MSKDTLPTSAEKPEEPAVTTFDFGDGNGPVPAHKHPNGGGWVADTATVAETAYVGPDAQVYGNAQVSENASVYGGARVFEDARVSGNARVTK
jgi:tetrahydrodipicolinate N-succinyltransferase